MHSPMVELLDLNRSAPSETRGFQVGLLVQITGEGRALVHYPGNPRGPIEARWAINPSSEDLNHNQASLPILLVFENGDPSLPIIAGIIREALYPQASSEEVTFCTERPHNAILDGRIITFDAKEEIILRCGKSSITLRKDGKVVVKGTQLVSRSSGTNKIKGATVSIN